ncbi:MAG: response regulator [Bacteroidales bacterium]|nr:response regulator [Bacteroidales bacterium]
MAKYNISVLLVEDDRLSLMVYSEFLKKIVARVYTAMSGNEGLDTFMQMHPEIIITDIMMPGMDGLEMIRQIKKIDQQVKVIMISGHSDIDYFIRSIDLGVDGYLLKPIDNVRLENKISELGETIQLSKKVAETEKKFQDFAALLPQVVFEADPEGRFTFVNRLALKKFGYTRKDFEKGLYMYDVISLENKRTKKDIRNIIASGANMQEQELMCRTKKGDLFPALIYTSGTTENGKLSGIRGVMVDITSQKKMMEELRSLNFELEEKVKERTIRLSDEIKEKEKAERELIKAKEKAEESDHLKGVFLANVSHEIQTPIKAIISFSNLLHAPNQDEKRREELVSIIESNSNALLNLINDILEFTKLQSQEIKLYRINFELNLFLKELFPVFETLKKKRSEKDIKLKTSLGAGSAEIVINSDPSRLRQVLTNLISNAFKFTHEGYVEYGYRIIDETGIRFHVKDTGLGISKQYQKKIFERFIQEPDPLGAKKEGTGLGLPITQSLISKLGGKIWVESASGKGSTFFFEIPRIIVAHESSKPIEKDEWKEKQVLIIEDDIKDYIALEEMLKGKVKLHYFNSAEQALEFYNSNTQVDLCLIGWDGNQDIELIKKIREKNPLQSIIGLFDSSLKGKAKSDLKKHFSAVLSKPVRKTELFKLLKHHLS